MEDNWKYLGDILSSDGKNDANIKARTYRGLGAITNIFQTLKDLVTHHTVLASKKIADETRKFCKERARNADTTLCNFTMQRLRDYFWLEEARANNEDDGDERGATVDVPSVAIELTEKSLMTRRKIKVERVTAAAVVNKSITTSEKVAKKKDGTGGSTESLPPLPLNNNSSDDDL